MLFAHDTEQGLLEVAALVNTVGAGREDLPDIAALDAFLRTWAWSGRRDRDESELRAVHALRPRLREFWDADEDRVVAIVNQLLRDGHALPQLVKHDGWDYHLHATPSDAPLATRMAVDAAMAILELVRTKELSRLRICDYPGCHSVVVDLSKNRSKRYCDGGCGNRAAVAAYRARKAEAIPRGGRRSAPDRARRRG
ncbi:MAG TPA: CGNR zinc finger domain-containing protein [Kofleriaceae bacterium]|jgi:predicted RNA-binding Zn ribbon-like protein|nr:CGNR zinc finger domain-containing protein [Kofleriaceae bacterium]